MRLLMCAPAPVSDIAGVLKLDTKFVDGMHRHVRDWGGPVQCVLWRSGQDIPFGKVYAANDLPFDLTVLDQEAPLPADVLDGVSAVMLSADMPNIGVLADQVIKARTPFVVTIEYTLATRVRILWLEKMRNPLRFMRSAIWLLNHEIATRRVIRAADGVQFNGFPASDTYGSLNSNALLYLDNRIGPELLATAGEMAARADRLRQGTPLRLIHSGRLEYLKGPQDLPALMGLLRDLGVDASLDVYGAGSLTETLKADFEQFGDMVRMHRPVDFETGLVPINRTQADIFISCHRQQDPSCSYLEAMGCGLAVAGYGNQMWRRLNATSGAGGVAQLGDVAGLAQVIANWNNDREALIAAGDAGLNFARQHSFPKEFRKRIDHVRALAIPDATGGAARRTHHRGKGVL